MSDETPETALTEGIVVEGTVNKIKPFGALVELPGNVHGLVHISHISSSYVQNINDYIAVGDVVKVKVLSIDTKNNKISLSIKEAEPMQRTERPEVRHIEYRGADSPQTFEEKFKEYVKSSNERLAGLNKRNKKKLN